MRTFIAIDISEEIRLVMAQAAAHLKYAGADVKWVDPANMHLTMKFLGEISEEKSVEVRNALDRVARSFDGFELSLNDLGAFPNMDLPRVIWAGLEKGASELKRLAALVDEELHKVGFDKESRPFEPHLTLGRVRSAKNRDKLKEKILSYASKIPAGSCRADSIILFKSTLTSKGSIYTKLYEAKFR